MMPCLARVPRLGLLEAERFLPVHALLEATALLGADGPRPSLRNTAPHEASTGRGSMVWWGRHHALSALCGEG